MFLRRSPWPDLGYTVSCYQECWEKPSLFHVRQAWLLVLLHMELLLRGLSVLEEVVTLIPLGWRAFHLLGQMAF